MFIEDKIMKKIENIFNEEAYHTITDTGLNVFIVYKPGFKKSVAAYGTSFGALNLVQEVNGEVVNHKKGLAHFLEHKLFEDEEGDILSQFTELGANANAFTSYDQTVYYFSTQQAIEKPLRLLIKLVNRIYLDEASIEKEKGIIVEELKMYENNPNMNLLMRTYENVYQTYPLRYDIGGDEASVRDTTLDDVLTAYEINYNPKKMALVIVSGDAPESILEIVNTSKIKPDHKKQVIDVFEPESLKVSKEEDVYQFKVQTPKASLSFKFEYQGSNTLKDEFLIRAILNMNFSDLNDDFQEWLDEDIINDYFSYDVDLRDGFGVIYFFNEGDKNAEFKALITDKMNHLVFDSVIFQQITKRYFGESILSLSQYDRYAINVLSAFFKNVSYFDYLKEIRNVNSEEIQQILSMLKVYSVSFTEMRP